MTEKNIHSRLDTQFALMKSEQRLGLMTHVVMGYPSLEETRERVLIMAQNGVDCIELQIPFSDPIADGPAITQANQVAVAHGVTTQACLDLLAQLRQEVQIPLILIGYYNTVLQYGVEKFVRATADSTADSTIDSAPDSTPDCDGFTFPDLPINEYAYESFYTEAHKAGIPMIQLVTPLTTPERLQQIMEYANGFVYCVARFGVTGSATEFTSEIQAYLQRVRKYVTLPIAVGFGIKTPQQIQQLHGLADMVVVGSALLDIPTNQLDNYLHSLCASL